MDARLQRSARQFVKFAVVGAVGTVVNLSILRLTLLAWEQVATTTPFAVEAFASSLAFAVAVINNFLLNRWWTFRSDGPAYQQFGKFLTVSLAGLLLNEICFWVFRQQLGVDVLLSQLLAIGCVLPFNFVFNKIWSFRGS